MSKKRNQNGKRNTNYKGKGAKDNKEFGKKNITDIHSNHQTNYDTIHSNDINWWNKSITYVDSTRLPFNRLSGDDIELGDIAPKGYLAEPLKPVSKVASLPSIMRINYVPTIGYANNHNAPVNRCFNSLYAAIYANTTGAMQFQQADLALVTLSLASIIANIAEVKRALGVSVLYANQNLALPRLILKSLGVDPDSVIGKQDEVRRKLNDCITNLNAMRLPGYVDLFKRAYQLPFNIYCDEDDIRAQMYAFVPCVDYFYTDNDPDVGEILQAEHRFWESEDSDGDMSQLEYLPIDYLLALLDRKLECVRNSSSFGLISGSIQRAFGDANLIHIDPVPADYVTVPTYDRNMLWQINNANFVGWTADVMDSFSVKQDPVENILICKPVLGPTINSSAVLQRSQFLNSYDNNTTDEFIMESTRLKVMGHEVPEGYEITAFGTEICENFAIYWHNEAQGDRILRFYTLNSNEDLTTREGLETTPGVVQSLAQLSKFRIHPYIYGCGGSDVTSVPFGDLYRYTTIDYQALDALHESALQSLYLVMVPSKLG